MESGSGMMDHIGPTGHSNFETNGQNLCQRKPLEGTVFAIRF